MRDRAQELGYGPCEGDGLDRLAPLQVQVHVDVALANDEEYVGFTEWWVRRARDANVEFGDLDPEEFSRLPFEVSAGAGDGSDVTSEGLVDELLPKVGAVLRRGDGNLSGSWSTAWMRSSSLRVAVNIKTSAFDLERATGDVAVWFGPGVLESAVDRVERSMAAMLAEAVERWDPLFANLADDNEPGNVALQIAMPRGRNPAWRDRRQLRGYSWVTYLCSELVDAVGGVGALRASGAFWEVSDMVGGGVLLRATEHLADFAGSRVRAVRDALAPVLPDGEMWHPRRPLSSGLRVAWDDGRNGPFDYGRKQHAYERAVQTGAWVVSL